MNNHKPITIALLPWGNVLEDYLESIGVSLVEFCTEMTGGWLFGYIEALKTVEIKTILCCISSKVGTVTRRIHQPSQTPIYLLPASKRYLSLYARMQNVYGWTVQETFGSLTPLEYPLFYLLRQLAPYLTNPIQQLSKIIRQEGCQAILCQEYEYPRFDVSISLGKLLKLPVFATFQGGNFQTWSWEKWIRPVTIRHCKGLIIASQVEQKRVKAKYQIPDEKIARIFNPLDLKLWQGGDRYQTRSILNIPSDGEVVVCHGRIERYRKGIDILLAAWREICQMRPNRSLWLLLVGTGNDAQWLHQTLETINLNNVIWINEYVLDRQRMVNYLVAADIYTLSSRHEGFPVAPLEAMACGLPIVATDVPGIADILKEGEHSGGIIVPKENATALAQGIGKLLDNPTLRSQCAKNAQKRVETAFSLPSVGQQLSQFLRKV